MIFTDSRYQLSELHNVSPGELRIGSRDRLFYADVDGVIPHLVQEGDTLHGLAAQYYSSELGETILWWAIADFQPEPILDPTIALTAGSTVLIPPEDYVREALSGMPVESIERI